MSRLRAGWAELVQILHDDVSGGWYTMEKNMGNLQPLC